MVKTESVENGTQSLKKSNPSEYGYIYSAERPKPPPEVGWKDKQATEDQKVNLYSENVVKEGDTTEEVDRESIANLSTTKRQWETIFTTQTTSPGESTLKKKGTPKWEVRLPYTEKRSAPTVESADQGNSEEPGSSAAHNGSEEEPTMFKKPVDTESAIEREIRLANEREEVLRKEKEERMKQMEKQQQKSQQQKSQGQSIIASYEAVSAESESCQPAYNELTEADRGPELWGMEAGARKEEDEDESDNSAAEDVNPNESIIEREIRLQRERDEEIARMRKQSASAQPQQQQQQHVSPPPEPVYIEPEEEEDVNHNQTKGVTYEDAIAKTSHEGESLIARELRELKEREEEIRRIHSNLHGTHITDEVDGSDKVDISSQKPSTLNVTPSAQKPQSSSPSPAQGTWQRDVSPFVSQNRRGSVDSASSHSTGRTPSDATPSRRDVRVQPIADGQDDDEDAKPNYFQKQETPIEREMRIARERENELRRLKGLPEIVHKDDDPYSSYGASPESNTSSSVPRPRSMGKEPTDSMKKFASSRLQQELLQQKNRELALRSEGKIISTSEEHIEPLKYMEVAGVDKVDGKEKRNFVTKKTSVSSYNEADVSQGQPDATSPAPQATRKTSSVAAGGQLFSYKEFKQTAESKIERELREMREREEELRMQRTGGQAETPR